MTGSNTLENSLIPDDGFAQKLARKSARRASLDRQISAMKKQAAQKARKAQTHRKILVGVAVLAEIESVGDRGAAWLVDLLRRRLTARDLAHPSVADLLLAHATAPQVQQGEAGDDATG